MGDDGSQSKYSARAWQPGNRQVVAGFDGVADGSGMRYLMVAMAASWPVTGSVTSRRQRASGLVHRSRAICEADRSEAFGFRGPIVVPDQRIGADHHVHSDVHGGV